MAKLAWGTAGERIFETGLDRGVLYVPGLDGQAWNGLTSVTEQSAGGEVEPFYVDGVKYLNFATTEEFEATIEAFSRPSALRQCEGVNHFGNGLYVTQQRKQSFGMTYRTLLGNDLDGSDHAYKLHLVYNATIAIPDKAFTTMGSTIDPTTFSWPIVTRAEYFEGMSRMVSHLVFDSRGMIESLRNDLEDILYGTDTTEPRLPTFQELHDMFVPFGF